MNFNPVLTVMLGFIGFLLYQLIAHTNKAQIEKSACIKPNDTLLIEYKNENPFEYLPNDTVKVLQLKGDYVQYMRKDGTISSAKKIIFSKLK